MKLLIEKIKAWKIFNTGIIKKIKDFIYFKFISPKKEGETDKYRKEIMDAIYRIFENKRWILSCGSFLRFYRDNTMFKQDLDILLYEDDFTEECKAQLINSGFRIKACYYNNDGKITEYKYIYKKVEVDIFIIRKDENDRYYIISTMEDKGEKLDINKKVENKYITVTGKDYKSWKRYITNFDRIKEYNFEGFKFYGPEFAKEHLKEIYGENWEVYDPSYDPRYAPENNMPIPSENAKAIVYLQEEEKELLL